jgi:hypothetical protein
MTEKPNEVTIADNGRVYVEGVKLPVCYDVKRRALVFYDKDAARSKRRGTRTLVLPLGELPTGNENGNQQGCY